MTHLDALLALAPAGVTVYDTTVPSPANYPYLLLGAPEFPELRLELDGAARPVGGAFTVTAVGVTSEQVREALRRSRGAFDRARPDVDGFDAWVRLDPHATSPLTADLSIKLPTTGHPIYAVDRYRYDATPTGGT